MSVLLIKKLIFVCNELRSTESPEPVFGLYAIMLSVVFCLGVNGYEYVCPLTVYILIGISYMLKTDDL